MSLGESDKKLLVDWASLPYLVLYLVSKRLKFGVIDYVLFRSVCESRRITAPIRPMLLLLASFFASRDEPTTTCALSTFNDNYIIPNKLQRLDFHPDVFCCRSPHGWLALFDLDKHIILFNPITKAQIHLPSLYEALLPLGIALSSNPSLDSSFFILQLTQDLHCPLAFLRYGDDSRTSIPHFEPELVEFAVFHEGRIVFVHGCNVSACNLGQEGSQMAVEETSLPYLPPDDQIVGKFLLGSSGDLLVAVLYETVIVNTEEDESESEEEISLLDLYRVDFIGDKMKLVKAEALADFSILLGVNYSLYVCASRHPVLRPNSVYCAHLNFPEDKPSIYRFSIGDSNNQRIIWPNSFNPFLCRKLSSIWVTPSLLS